MKRIILTIAFLEFASIGFSQLSEWRLLSSGGGKQKAIGVLAHASFGQLMNQESLKTYTGFQFLLDPLLIHTKSLKQFKEKINIAPNPASEYFQIKLEKFIPADLIIFDHLGGVLLQLPITNSEMNIPVNSIPPGNYFILIKNCTHYFSQSFIVYH